MGFGLCMNAFTSRWRKVWVVSRTLAVGKDLLLGGHEQHAFHAAEITHADIPAVSSASSATWHRVVFWPQMKLLAVLPAASLF